MRSVAASGGGAIAAQASSVSTESWPPSAETIALDVDASGPDMTGLEMMFPAAPAAPAAIATQKMTTTPTR